MSAVEFQVVQEGPHERLKPRYPHFAIKAVENNTNRDHKLYDFNRWRPKFHLIAPKGWLNDPCALGYDAARDRYHVGFQWNPKSAEWDHISWGAAWSSDLVTWDVAQSPSITPETDGDRSTAVFTGCMSPITVGGSDTLTSVYTSTTHLPIHYTLPYIWGQETIHLGLSSDGGRTWECLEGNPVVPGPPPGIDVTGWRDPFVARWPSVARILGDAKETLYAIVSGGIRNNTPTTFLYRIDRSLWNWTFVSPIANMPMNFSPSRWAADFGLNWEVTNFLTLDADPEIGEVQDFLVMGAEGRQLPPGEGKKPAHTEVRASHAQMWMCGEPISKDRGVELKYRYGGFLDHGAYYAGNSFWDPKTKSHIIIGWVFEEDLPLKLRKRQGWAGSLSIPRVLKLQTLKSVVGAWKSALEDIGSISVREESSVDGKHSTSTITTLSVTPDPRLRKLRGTKKSLSPGLLIGGRADLAFAKPAAQWELCVSFSIGKASKRVGFSILHSIDRSLRTTVFFEPETETLAIDRTQSTTIPGVCVAEERAPHTLFKFNRGGRTTTEELSFRCFFDTSVLELFANERTAITTRVYPDSNTCVGVEVFVEGDRSGQGDEGTLLECDLWTLNL